MIVVKKLVTKPPNIGLVDSALSSDFSQIKVLD
ncbi:Hypothetical protein BSM4216_0302 [Bacillus smithii]|nr:Hypothetical protein BSM4216_0302 [Bacillus smithii]